METSVWVSHFRESDPVLRSLLLEERVVCHPFIVGELACGGFRNRAEILESLQALPQAPEVGHQEILVFLEAWKLMGRGIGLVDVHLLAAAVLQESRILTRDRRLREAATELGISYG